MDNLFEIDNFLKFRVWKYDSWNINKYSWISSGFSAMGVLKIWFGKYIFQLFFRETYSEKLVFREQKSLKTKYSISNKIIIDIWKFEFSKAV